MKNAMIQTCPRCGERSLEKFVSHSYCANCNYDDVTGLANKAVRWAVNVLKTAKPESVLTALVPRPMKLVGV